MSSAASFPLRSASTVSICVCTFRRPHISDTLRSLGRLVVPEDAAIEIVVADNDDKPSARNAVELAALSLPWPVSYIHSPGANISIARNACLDGAKGNLIAFIDDDEIARPNWLAELVATMQRDRAAAVLGPVQAVYAPSAPSWMRHRDFHSTYPVVVRGAIRTGYTCNVLIDRRASCAEPLRFDLSRGRSGGEDTDYFTRLHRAGGRIAFAPEAWVEEAVPETRASLNWLARRRFRMGQTHGHLLREEGKGRIGGSLTAIAKAASCFAMMTATLPASGRWQRNFLRGVLHLGTVAGLIGVREISQYGNVLPGQEGTVRAA